MKKHIDKTGRHIEAGDILFNPADRDGEHEVLTDGEELYLGDFDSPLERYIPHKFWEIISR